MYTLKDIEMRLGIKSYVIRFWENNFPQISSTVDNGSERVYLEKDLELFQKIQKFLYEDNLSIEEVQSKLDNTNGSVATRLEKDIPVLLDEKTLPPPNTDFLMEVKKKLDEILKMLRSDL